VFYWQKVVPGEQAAEGGGPYGFDYQSISGSGKRRKSIRQPPNSR
jgi:hypothetical protein